MGGGNSDSQTQQESGPPAFQQEHLEGIFDESQRLFENNPLTFQGRGPAGFTENQLAGQEGLLNFFAPGGPGAGFLGNVADAQQFALGDVLDVANNPALRNATQALTGDFVQQFNEGVAPGVRANALGAGSFGGSRADVATNKALEGVASQAADANAAMLNQAYQSGLNTFNQGLALAPQTSQLLQSPFTTQLAIGGAEQEQEQANLDFQTEAGNFNMLAPFLALEQYLSTVGGDFGGEGTSSTDARESLFQKLFGGLI